MALILVAGCVESPSERLERVRAEVDTQCWSFSCPGIANSHGPDVPTETGVDCMNEALASGARAYAYWSEEDFAANVVTSVSVFTVDHEVIAFQSIYYGGSGRRDVEELSACTGPFRVGSAICSYFGVDSSGDAAILPVFGLAWDGCR